MTPLSQDIRFSGHPCCPVELVTKQGVPVNKCLERNGSEEINPPMSREMKTLMNSGRIVFATQASKKLCICMIDVKEKLRKRRDEAKKDHNQG